MELGLTLGMASKSQFEFMQKTHNLTTTKNFSMGLSIGQIYSKNYEDDDDEDASSINGENPIQLDLLPHASVSQNGSSEAGSSGQIMVGKGVDVNRLPAAEMEDGPAAEMEDGPAESSPNSGGERTSSRASDDDENGSCRKKLRLSKEQSVFLEESFKEHNTLNPKQKVALAKQLNLRPRQVEVWFQNRRARTKLKQTEVDCEYLKRCCETLTEENRRLHRELQDLRALKNSNPFYMQLPATTLTMCPSCERVATASTSYSAAPAAPAANPLPKSTGLSLSSKPRFYPKGS